jgi:hypothetical protein
MRIYIYNENCASKGRVAQVVSDATARTIDALCNDDKYEEANDAAGVALGDCHFAEGTEDELIADARTRLTTRHDIRPGGAGDAFDWRCSRAVLDYLGVDDD